MKQVESTFEKIMMLLSFLLFCCCTSGNKAKSSAVDVYGKQSFKIESRLAPLGSKVFAAFTALNNQPVSVAAFNSNPSVRNTTETIRKRYEVAARTCESVECLVSALLIRSEEKKLLLNEYTSWSATTTVVPFGKTPLLDRVSNSMLNEAEVETDLVAVNHIVSVYVGGASLRYPKIDGGGFAKGDPAYLAKIREKIRIALGESGTEQVFFAVPMLVSLEILELNGRNEAARYDPVIGGVNKDAFKQVTRTDFSKYPYSAIIVPGLGPAKAGISLDSGGAARCRLAAAEYRKKKAPFIIVSGGHTHPDRTPFSEGIEMKKYMVEKLGLPASAVIAEPYARHTTTNVRNGLRIVYAFGMPASKPVMLVSDLFQSSYVMMMKGRFMEEIGFLPYKSLKQDNDRKPYFIPDSAALKRNPYDPLDP
ncbi:MAG: YdcF family protein [Chitinophagaceae bacterium]|nr:MAG: YdcF family protein [Chitinophagaceae bacterium]